jgi:RNA-binding protein with serine-rich domain 1
LSRAITKDHVQEIFERFGKIHKIEHSIDRRTNLPMDMCYVTYGEKADAEKAIEYMDQAQLDGLEIKVQFTLRPANINNNRQNSPRRFGGRGGRPAGKWRRSPSPQRYGNRDNNRKRAGDRGNSPSPKRQKDMD